MDLTRYSPSLFVSPQMSGDSKGFKGFEKVRELATCPPPLPRIKYQGASSPKQRELGGDEGVAVPALPSLALIAPPMKRARGGPLFGPVPIYVVNVEQLPYAERVADRLHKKVGHSYFAVLPLDLN